MVFFFATGIMKQSDAYKIALARAQANSAVIEAIGSPIAQTGIVSGNSNVNGPTGEANLSVPSEEIGRPLDVSNHGRQN